TSYYDLLIPLWAGIYDRKTYLASLSKDVTRFLNTPGRKIQPLSESSFDAWIKLYRRDANSDNSQISYYLKGQLVSLLLDLLIRARHNNKRSLNNVILQLWQRFGEKEIGFKPKQLREVITSVADTDLTGFFNSYLNGTEELTFNEYLEPFGLQVSGVKEKEPVPHLGIVLNETNGPATIKFVEIGSPASRAGLDAGDELLAIDGYKVTAELLSDRLKDYCPGDIIQISVFHAEQLFNYEVKLGESVPSRYKAKPVKSPTKEQEKLLAGWLENK
ncbi:MAG: PDZ domain-containing protein, partial [Spirulinaceae cyanobacterium]